MIKAQCVCCLPHLAGLLDMYSHPFAHNLNHDLLENHQLQPLAQASPASRSFDLVCLDNAQS